MAHRAWKKVKGDQTLSLDYDLNENSVVFDVGGYKGDFASKIYEKFGARIYLSLPKVFMQPVNRTSYTLF